MDFATIGGLVALAFVVWIFGMVWWDHRTHARPVKTWKEKRRHP